MTIFIECIHYQLVPISDVTKRISAYVNSTNNTAWIDALFQVTNVPPLGYAIYTARTNTSLGIVVVMMLDVF